MNRRLRVLHVIPSISPRRGGPSNAVIHMVKALLDEGVDASILTTSDNGCYRQLDLPTGKWFMYRDVKVLIQPCIDSNFRWIKEFLISLQLTRWLLINISQYDVVHVHALFSYPSTVTMLIARLRQVPYILRTIGQLNDWSLSQGAFKKKVMLKLIEQGNLNHSMAVHVTSENEEKDIMALRISTPIIKTSLGVEIPKLELTDVSEYGKRPIRVLFLSRLHPKKQIEILFEALKRVREQKRGISWHLYIAGDGERLYKQKIERLTVDLGIQEKVTWCGHVEGETKADLFKKSDWYVLPSAGENFGISAVEAMAFGLPVILSDKVGIADNVRAFSAGLVCRDSVQDLTEALGIAFEITDTYKMRCSARNLVKMEYSWKKTAVALKAIYEKGV